MSTMSAEAQPRDQWGKFTRWPRPESGVALQLAAHVGAPRDRGDEEDEELEAMWRKIEAAAAAGLVVLGGLVLGACAAEPPDDLDALQAATDEPGVELVVDAPAETPIPEVATEAPTPEPTIIADEWDWVGPDGTIVEGSEYAPVRIGADTPGQPPAAEASVLAIAPGKDRVAAIIAAGKYDVGAWYSDGLSGWVYKVFGPTRFSERDELNIEGAQKVAGSGQGWTKDEMFAYGFRVDGRVMDRAEYALLVVE